MSQTNVLRIKQFKEFVSTDSRSINADYRTINFKDEFFWYAAFNRPICSVSRKNREHKTSHLGCFYGST